MIVHHCEECGVELEEDELNNGGQDRNSGESFYWCEPCNQAMKLEAEEAENAFMDELAREQAYETARFHEEEE